MLKLISLWTFKKIFERSKITLSSSAKMLYINCMIHHFEELDERESNSHAFKIYEGEIEMGKYMKSFSELQRAGLVQIEDNGVIFENHWGQFIDRSALIKSLHPTNTIAYHEQELLSSQTLFEYVSRTNRITKESYEQLLKKFIEEQKALNKVYADYNDVSRHFFFWIQKQKPTTSQGSSTKILGM